MSGFSAEWLALREPHDMRARNVDVLAAVAASLKPLPAVRIVDLACGTGSTVRALSRHLPARQNWQLVDNDIGLLGRAASMPRGEHIAIKGTPLDLNRDLEAALDGPIDLVTTSALLDLVSEAWLDRLATEIAARRIPFYAALSYDGRTELAPHDPLDAKIVSAVNAHQLTDKGFGPALGPGAANFAVARFKALDYSVVQGLSDWAAGPADRDFQNEILSGWANAAGEMDVPASETAEWLAQRRKMLAAGQSSLRVGHVDFFAAPAAAR